MRNLKYQKHPLKTWLVTF